MKVVAWADCNGAVMSATKRDGSSRSAVANRFNRALVEADEARAAVAELIEAANGVLRWESGDGRPERQRLRAALARVGGAP